MSLATTTNRVIIGERFLPGRKFLRRLELLMNVRVSTVVVLAALLASAGCDGPSAKVTGRVTCQGKPVVGSIQFSPKGEIVNGAPVPAQLREDGSFERVLNSIGIHTVVVSPKDLKYPVPPGEFEYPCDRSPIEWDVKARENDVVIEMKNR